MQPIRVIWASPNDVHVVVPEGTVIACYHSLRDAEIPGVQEAVPGSNTVQVRLEPALDHSRSLDLVRSAVSGVVHEPATRLPRRVDIPLCSDPDLAPDLADIARGAGLSTNDAADLHAAHEHVVRFIGFAPGFPYIDGLPEPLHTTRLETPRTRVRPGSVGIAGGRSGIYPHQMPGGWRLIGATPRRLFNPSLDEPALLAPGDRVRFRRITRDEYDRLDENAQR